MHPVHTPTSSTRINRLFNRLCLLNIDSCLEELEQYMSKEKDQRQALVSQVAKVLNFPNTSLCDAYICALATLFAFYLSSLDTNDALQDLENVSRDLDLNNGSVLFRIYLLLLDITSPQQMFAFITSLCDKFEAGDNVLYILKVIRRSGMYLRTKDPQGFKAFVTYIEAKYQLIEIKTFRQTFLMECILAQKDNLAKSKEVHSEFNSFRDHLIAGLARHGKLLYTFDAKNATIAPLTKSSTNGYQLPAYPFLNSDLRRKLFKIIISATSPYEATGMIVKMKTGMKSYSWLSDLSLILLNCSMLESEDYNPYYAILAKLLSLQIKKLAYQFKVKLLALFEDENFQSVAGTRNSKSTQLRNRMLMNAGNFFGHLLAQKVIDISIIKMEKIGASRHAKLLLIAIVAHILNSDSPEVVHDFSTSHARMGKFVSKYFGSGNPLLKGSLSHNTVGKGCRQ